MTSLEAKIVVLGSQGVGKTSLVHRYVHGTFAPSSSQLSTIGASFLTKRVLDTDTDTVVRLQIWDTAGQERFRSISRLYYRGANACILCYAITDEASFREMGRWLRDLRKELGESVILHVVGTKADLVAQDPSRREVPFERCIAYVAENLNPELSSTPPASVVDSGRTSFLDGARSPSSKRSSGFWGQEVGWDCCHEISAENGEGVEEVFRVVTRKLVEQARKGLETASATPAGGEEQQSYFEGSSSRGSFRVGRDNRRSWLGFPPGMGVGVGVGVAGVAVEEGVESQAGEEATKGGRKCC